MIKSYYGDMSKLLPISTLEAPDLSADGLLSVKTVSFHHETPDILLASYGNGEIRLYDVNLGKKQKHNHLIDIINIF